jgi:hypothetical protein
MKIIFNGKGLKDLRIQLPTVFRPWDCRKLQSQLNSLSLETETTLPKNI